MKELTSLNEQRLRELLIKIYKKGNEETSNINVQEVVLEMEKTLLFRDSNKVSGT
ncbi:hypothetical protein [Sediminibacillus massiliensis]|uniref:hypothetical protein n=1 Tax=Sediminibacillus massiliensis TaxID=1926277 RepID=UPI0015C2D844|nr:hypothetical protein [Sediminibacillus massiliensis]